MAALVAPRVPFRWDLITPDNLGTLLDGVQRPRLWFAEELTICAAKVVAHSGDADLFFVGRSLDSMFDLLGGALADTVWHGRVRRLPLSFKVSGRMHQAQVLQGRRILAQHGLHPRTLARRDRPVAFVDVVKSGSTFTELFGLLRGWVDTEREPWSVIRRKLRFVGVTPRTKTSPDTWRWHRHTEWTAQLPGRGVRNVSLDPLVWSYLGDHQVKLTRTFRPEAWLSGEPQGPRRGAELGAALAEAVAVVKHGRSREVRKMMTRVMSGEPAVAEAWLRTLIGQLNA